MAKTRVRLFHWHEAEAAERVGWLEKAGFDADFEHKVEPGFARRMRDLQPDVLVIDLSRLPSHGREVGIYARRTKALRMTPIVFVGGEPEKVERIRALIPDAGFTEWAQIKPAIRDALRHAPAVPILPDPYMKRWEASPLAKKLGLEDGTVAALIGAPEGFAEFVRAPEGVRYAARVSPDVGLVILFAKSIDELDLRLEPVLAKLGPSGRLWICWPKAGAKQFKSDLTQNVVLETARAHGLTTSKIVSVDENWSGMKFSPPRPYRTG
jgi:hypothetical protein